MQSTKTELKIEVASVKKEAELDVEVYYEMRAEVAMSKLTSGLKLRGTAKTKNEIALWGFGSRVIKQYEAEVGTEVPGAYLKSE